MAVFLAEINLYGANAYRRSAPGGDVIVHRTIRRSRTVVLETCTVASGDMMEELISSLRMKFEGDVPDRFIETPSKGWFRIRSEDREHQSVSGEGQHKHLKNQ